MKYISIAAVIAALSMFGCRNSHSGAWDVLSECDRLSNAGDTTSAWITALEKAENLSSGSGDKALLGELYYQKACYEVAHGGDSLVTAYLDKSLELYKESGNAGGIAKLSLTKGQFLNSVSDYGAAVDVLKAGLSRDALSDSIKGQLLAELSVSFLMEGNMDSALVYGREAMPLVKASADSESFVVFCGNIGIAYRRVGQNDSAMVCYKQGLETALKAGDDESAAYLYNNLSVLYCELERYDEALRYAADAKNAAEKSGEMVEYCSAVANEGIAYSKKGDNAMAVTRLADAYRRAQELNSLVLKLKLINHLISAYLNLGKTDLLDYYMNEGELLASQLPPESIAAAGILQSKANVLLSTGKYRQALDAYGRLAQIGTSMPAYKILGQKARCYAGMGDYKEAFALQQRSVEMLDSVRSADSEKQLSEYSAKFKTYEKELEINRLTEANLRQKVLLSRIVLAVVAIVALAVIALVYLLYRRRLRRHQAEMMLSRKYIDGLESERSRLARELHDGVCNDLLALGMKLKSGNSEKSEIIEQLDQTRSNLRQISHELIPPSFKIAGLNEILSGYCEGLALPSGLVIEFCADGSDWSKVPVDVAYELYRIAQEATSNVIKHSGATKAVVKIERDAENRVVLSVDDNGSASGPGDVTGVGLRTIRDRAKSIGAQCEWGNSPSGFKLKVTVKI